MTVRYSKETADEICRRLESGETLRAICRSEGMPVPSAVLKWTQRDPAFGKQYARAREAGYQAMADEIIEISDDGSNDWMQRKRGDVVDEVVDHDHIARSRLRVDSRKWLLSKALPKLYGDKLQHTGADGGPVATEVVYRWADPQEDKASD